jgi:hypothetical protein
MSGKNVSQAQANQVVMIPILDSYRFGSSRSHLGETTFVKAL